MEINIVAAGPKSLIPELSQYNNENTIWVGVDRGVYTIISANLKPDYAFGDFDSVSSQEMAVIENTAGIIKKYNSIKNETDLELALLWALENNPAAIRVFGATGGRLDHLLGNIHLALSCFKHNPTIKFHIIDLKNEATLKSAGSYTILMDEGKKYVSFIPFQNTIENLTLKGFKYPLLNETVPFGSTLCISNELCDENGHYSFTDGILLVVRSSD